ncbi:hypothetical protein AB0J80_03700 [Actinoplanes sp. NPDC049548]|uniref:hypothetical protein n=1 Tax=Actinoplanes sp. NPDC049548 TaxID=3155152 RepID=UPI0034125827
MTLRRYLLPEVVGTAAAVAAVALLHRGTGSAYAAAWGGSVAEAVGYYGVILWRDTTRSPAAGWLRAVVAQLPGTLVEFGPAEALDTLLVRPALLYAAPLVTGNLALGTLAGKIAADVAFYALVLPCRRLRRHWLPAGRRRTDGAGPAVVQEAPEMYQ